MWKSSFGYGGYTVIMITVAITIMSILMRTIFVSASMNQVHVSRSKVALSSSVPAQGLYDSCAPEKGSICYDRLKQMAQAGFTLVLNYDQLSGDAQQQLAYASWANQLNMKIIWAMNSHAFWDGTDLKHRYRALAATCDCFTNQDFLHYFVNLVKDLPATWGYYIGDEVPYQDHSKVRELADKIRQLDPFHPQLLIAGASTIDSVATNLLPFTDTADVLGADYYPVGSSYMPLQATANIASAVQSITDQVHKPSALVLQAFSWSQYPDEAWRCSPFPSCAHFPTKDEMCQMLTLALSNAQPQILLWYSYQDILRSNDPAGHLQTLSEVIQTCN
ncbi:MAG TPA: hypothetical protein VFB60_01050 [Ktedonobacteraceae bacterium]|nr:hypothetical protein [Ktedonobacteraceae bacterium]